MVTLPITFGASGSSEMFGRGLGSPRSSGLSPSPHPLPTIFLRKVRPAHHPQNRHGSRLYSIVTAARPATHPGRGIRDCGQLELEGCADILQGWERLERYRGSCHLTPQSDLPMAVQRDKVITSSIGLRTQTGLSPLLKIKMRACGPRPSQETGGWGGSRLWRC